LTLNSDDVTDLAVTVTDVRSDQGTMIVFDGFVRGDVPVTFAADHRTAAAILEALRAGETPVADVPSWAVVALGCPDWCGYEDVHVAEQRATVTSEPIVTCKGYGVPVNDREG
jgi:hypothetical protein